MSETDTDESSVEDAGLSLIDCDVHPGWESKDDVYGRLPKRYRRMDRGMHLYSGGMWTNPIGFESGAGGHDVEGHAASTPEKVREHHLADVDADYLMLNGDLILHLGVFPNADYATALATAYNDWLIERWLDADERFLGSLLVAPQRPDRAAEEIRRVGNHPRIRQVLMGSANQLPYGNQYYWPIYEAAEEYGLPVAIHPGTEGRGIANPPSAGYPSTYFEWHSAIPTTYMAQVISLVCEGVFVEFPELNFVCIEGGLSWVPHVMWRLDRNWRSLRTQTPWLERRPSEYITDHVRFTTQPVEEPDDPGHLLQIFEMMNAEETVMFSSDYPHWDGDSPTYGLPKLPEPLSRSLYYENAQELYGLPDDPSDL
jgi:predicted TIM-barrel fold metal-dependent hydrolase